MVRTIRPLVLALCLVGATPAAADFVLNNLRVTLYHELAHALIDQLRLPVFGPEESAADSFALVFADRVHDEPTNRALIRDLVRLGRAEAAEEYFDPWREYMPGAQRTARSICIWYGLDPGARGELARALGMPREVTRVCAEAGGAAKRAWSAVLDTALPAEGAEITLRPAATGKALRLLKADIAAVNARVALPHPTPLTVEDCGQDNAYYYNFDDRMVICSEMVGVLRARAAAP
ncbi:hypothetical protein JSE7799_01571 [Jannaschia seosinensis]|uniref:Metallopeptidase n=1 Tax=Jannaschia seosinensis TaxID=313367 RepID=A0A0M7BA88_9RHOB|nr:DUF4344 domain-containing metallopeptidase [Jannaschia seosinensis]CUH38853.1 hypothetical protein JSE7799_01571 [Jannaschia seosinensis]